MFKKSDIIEKGYIDERIPEGTDIKGDIEKMKKEKDVLILAHYYQTADIQDIADFVGDSLDLSRKAEASKAGIILFAGVHFMAETAKILSPGAKVLLPDLNAGCSLSDTCPPEEFKKFLAKHPGRTVISYINSSAEIKALSDIICTSANAYKIIESLAADEKIIFAPDRNLGNYVSNLVKRDMIIWQGACHVHEEFSLESILELKNIHKEAKIIVHPECELPVRMIADFIGSTGAMLKYIKTDDSNKYIVGTEPGIIHQMSKARPDKTFIPAPGKDSTCACSECNFMKLITMKKLYLTLKYEEPEIVMDEDLMERAGRPIRRMLDISDRLGL
ncbi:MAG: quinolinate synthase NadA [Bacteroidales bacterium]|nr:quinolinate synthase NadA [Bacteroidales bacterium]